jgi:hypothetical protein
MESEGNFAFIVKNELLLQHEIVKGLLGPRKILPLLRACLGGQRLSLSLGGWGEI